jgi:GH18 family chitinase
MKRITSYFTAIILFSIMLSACTPSQTQPLAPTPTTTAELIPVPGGKHLIGYYPAWAAERGVFVKDIPADKLTHINYAFSNVSENGECVLGDSKADVERVYSADESVNGLADSASAAFHGNFNQLLELKQKYPGLKVLISIGGWSWSGNFSNAAQGDRSRQQFVASCIDLYLKQYKGVFDGLDIDWEYPVSGGLTPGQAEDKRNFTMLLIEFRNQLRELEKTDNRHYLLTIAAPSGPSNIRNIQPDLIAMLVDWANLMTYDLHGTWEPTTNFNAPLFKPATDPADASMNVDAVVQKYLSLGVPPEKLVLGVPFYGYGWADVSEADHGLYQSASGAAPGTWEAGAYDYKDIQQNYLSKYQRQWDNEAYVPWLYDTASKTFISYDDPQSLEAKAGYARDLGLSGVMIWELSQGDESLVDALRTGLASGGPPRPTPAPTVMVPRPNENQIHSVSGIVLDGKLEDWPAAPDVVLNSQSQVAYSIDPQSWEGPQDLSAEIWRGWTTDGLYFAFKVTDDIHLQPNADANIWHGDYMELQFDTQLEQDFTDGTMSDDDYQIGLSVGDYDKVPPVAVAWFNGPAPAAVLSTVQMAYTTTADGYILEAFIPKEALAGITLAEGATMGMSISPSDADNATEGQKVMLSTSPIRTYADPRTFGKITLVK